MDTATSGKDGEVDIERRFGGIARLYGAAALSRFATAHAVVIGLGGVGSWAVESLARSGVGALTLVDLDHVAESNINRQVHAVEENLGKAKVRAMSERVAAINPRCRVNVVDDFASADNVHELIARDPDAVIECTDNFRTKADIIAALRRARLYVITVGAAGGRIDPTRIRTGDLSRTEHDALLSRVRKRLRQEYGFTRNPRRRFDVPCVWSDEHPVFPDGAGGTCPRPRAGEEASGLSCAAGIGSVTHVTASFAFVAVSRVLKRLADS